MRSSQRTRLAFFLLGQKPTPEVDTLKISELGSGLRLHLQGEASAGEGAAYFGAFTLFVLHAKCYEWAVGDDTTPVA